MLIADAKKFVGHVAHVSYTDRSGQEYVELAEIFDVGFVPLYGPCFITDVGEIRLDRILSCETAAQARVA